MREKGIALIALAICGLLVASGPRAVFAQSDFTIAANPATLNVQAGMTGTSNITVTSSNVDTVNLAINNTSICSLSQSSLTVTPPATNSSTLSCKSLVVGTVAVNVTGTSGSFQHWILVTFLFKVLVNLDGNSIGPTDIVVSASASQAKSFRVGAVVNASSTNSISNVFGWQFEIDYNATAFIPQGDPSPAASPGNPGFLNVDGATNTVLFGANLNLVNAAGVTTSWNALLGSGAAFGSFTNQVAGSTGQLQVFYTLVGSTFVTISAKNLLANVQFELLTKPSPTTQSFAITNVIFADRSSNPILRVTSGAGASETITNSPPVAKFTVTALIKGDPSCVPVTGSNCTAYAFQFDGSTSTDADGTISAAAGTAGFFWDFGDQQQDGFYPGSTFSGGVTCTNLNPATFTCQGAVAIHDYGVQGQFIVTLRVQDNLGATGSARDSLGGVILNAQPSHTSQTVAAANGFSITSNPGSLSIGPSSVGSIGTSTITLTSVTSGFSGTISLSAASNPSGPNAPTFSFNPSQVNLKAGGTNSSLFTVSVGSATPHLGYNVTVSGTIGQLVNNFTLRLIPTAITVQPAVVTGVASGGSFTVDITGSAADLFGWQFQLNYNKTLLSTSLPGITFGSFWQKALNTNQGFVVRQVNQTGGYVIVAFTLLSGATSFNGNATLASIVFNVKSSGVTTLRLSKSFLPNSTARLMPFAQGNGVFCNISCLSHDVAITSLVSQPSGVNIGGNVTISASVINRGLNPENVTVNVLVGTSTIGQREFFLYPGDNATVTLQWDTRGLAAGYYSIMVQATIVGNTDGNTTNNSLSGSVTLNQPGGSSSLLPYLIAAAAAAAVIAITFLVLRRRRVPHPTPAM